MMPSVDAVGRYFPLTVAVVQWFDRHRARALSAMGFGLAAGWLNQHKATP